MAATIYEGVMMVYDENGSRIVELLDPDGWHRTTLRDVRFLASVFGEQQYRAVEGSVDGGITWLTRYNEELELLGKSVCDNMIWRIKS